MAFKNHLFFLSLLTSFLLFVNTANTDVVLPAIIGSDMVLQQNTSALLWGWAEPRETVEINTSWGQTVITSASDEGKWKVAISTPEEGGPHTITIKANNTITLNNILTGEVWICSGQSNMEMPVGCIGKGYRGVLNYEEELTDSNYPNIRLFNIKKDYSLEPKVDCQGKWKICNNETGYNFSATAFFFGKRLHRELNIPIGLICASWGGTPAQAWTSLEYVKKVPGFKQQIKLRKDKEYLQKFKEQKNRNREPSVLYNAMINPLIPYTIRGAIWYQGEANVGNPEQYQILFPTMIQCWRDNWNHGDFPFYFVQIAPYKGYRNNSAFLRQAQFMTLSVANTGMVVTTDITDLDDIHPRQKQQVGYRLAKWALAKTYDKDLVFSGPLYKSMEIQGDKIRLYFDYVDGGLVAREGKLTHFTIANNNKQFVPAKAEIDGETVVVYSSKVKNPVAVRFGFDNTATPNLFNEAGLPASTFRTDNW